MANSSTLAVLLASGLLLANVGEPVVREQRTLTVDSRTELWRLEWRETPQLVCFPDTSRSDWYTCPCAGFAYGERGSLDLVRVRRGAEERMPLTPLFSGAEGPATSLGLHEAVLRRWPVFPEDTAYSDPTMAQRVKSRGPAEVMAFADYDHDGQATEFLLRIGAGPCGHGDAVVVGISRLNPRLHAFATVEHQNRPLVLGPQTWDALLRSHGKVVATEVHCGDHGSEEEFEVVLLADQHGLHAVRRTYGCLPGFRRGRRESSEVL